MHLLDQAIRDGTPRHLTPLLSMVRERSRTPPWKKRDSHASGSEQRSNRRPHQDREHWKQTVYVTMVWGTHLDYQVEAFVLGMCLQRTSTKRRILFASPDLMEHGLTGLLGSVWELRQFEYLEGPRRGHSWRLSKVWNKLQVWELLADEFEVAILLDTDIVVAGSMDACFNVLQHAEVGGVFRGKGNFSLTSPRPASSIKTTMTGKAKGKWKKNKGGGINGGVIVFKPSKQTCTRMIQWLNEGYEPPDNVGAEQNFISEFFGLDENIQQIDLSYNFQVHQLGLSAQDDAEEGRWSTLVKRFEEIVVFHYSAVPKPVHLFLGDITERTCDHLHDTFKGALAGWLCNTLVPLERRIHVYSETIYDHHKVRAMTFASPSSDSHDQIMRETANKATQLWFDTFYNQVWPSYMDYIMKKLLENIQDEEGLCIHCGHEWNSIGCAQHVLFTCPFIQPIAMASFKKHGPGTGTNIQCGITQWLAYIRKFGSNPLQLVDGIEMQVRFAYIDMVVRKYVDETHAELALQNDRLNFVPQTHWTTVLNKYKITAKTHFFGSAHLMFQPGAGKS